MQKGNVKKTKDKVYKNENNRKGEMNEDLSDNNKKIEEFTIKNTFQTV